MKIKSKLFSESYLTVHSHSVAVSLCRVSVAGDGVTVDPHDASSDTRNAGQDREVCSRPVVAGTFGVLPNQAKLLTLLMVF